MAQFALFAVAAVLIGMFFVESRWGIIFGNARDYDNRLELFVPQAMGAIPGERVVAGGEAVGEITDTSVTDDGKAHLTLGVDNTVWPLPQDSTLTLRMGGTIKRTDRFIDLAPGSASKFFESGDQVPADQFIVPVEYADLFNVFDPDTRKGLHDFFANGGPTMKAVADPLHSALDVAPPVLDNAAAVFRDVSYDTQALSTLVSATAEVTGAIASSNPDLQTLISGGAKTFTAASADAKALQTTLEDAANAFRVDGAMFAHGAKSLPKIAALAEELNPALTELDNLAEPLNATLRKLIDIEPNAVDTLRTVRRAAPTLENLLASARTKLMPPLGSVARQGAKDLKCIRPFTPDIMAFLQGWGGFFGPGFDDPKVHMLHTLVSFLPFPNTMPVDSKTITDMFPNLEIQNPHAPGQGWNQPWFLPECGVTPEGFDSANDPESGTYDANGSKTVPYPELMTQRGTNIMRAVIALLVAGAIVLIVMLASGKDGYVLKLAMTNASGLRPGSQVLLGGVSIGTVDELEVDRKRQAVVTNLKLDADDIKVGEGAKARIVAANLLGEKFVDLKPGDASKPLPSGSTLPPDATTLPTDLDEIVGTFDTSTRARLAALLHSAGVAVSGRKEDVNAIIRQFPLSVEAATDLLNTMVQDNHTLAELVENSNEFIVRINRQKSDLRDVIDASAGAASIVAARANELEQALPFAPAGLRSFHDLFVAGSDASDALSPSVLEIADSLPQLDRLLKAVAPFTDEAVPTLDQAADVAPTLSRLADEATPTLNRAIPTLRKLKDLGALGGPLSSWLGLASEDLINIFGGWSGAIQFRDGVSHIFNGTLYLNPRVILNVANRGASATQRCQNLLDVKNPDLLRTMGLLADALAAKRSGCEQAAPTTPARDGQPHRPSRPAEVPPAPQQAPAKQPPLKLPEIKLPKIPGVNLPEVKLPELPGPAKQTGDTLNSLLDYLLKP